MIAFQCPKCEAAFKTTDDKAGFRSKCPKCGCPVKVPNCHDELVAVDQPSLMQAKRKTQAPPMAELLEEPVKESTTSATPDGRSRTAAFGLFAFAIVLVCAGSAALLIYAVAAHRSVESSSQSIKRSKQPPSPKIESGAQPINAGVGNVNSGDAKVVNAEDARPISVHCSQTLTWGGVCQRLGEWVPTSNVFLVELELTNHSDRRSVVCQGWENCAELEDGFGNNCRQLNFGLDFGGFGDGPWGFNLHSKEKVMGIGLRLDPGKTYTVWLPFEYPIDQAKQLRLSLPARQIGGTGMIRLAFPVNYVSPATKQAQEQAKAAFEKRQREEERARAERRVQEKRVQEERDPSFQRRKKLEVAVAEMNKQYDGKPLDIADLIAREEAQQKEMREINRSGNFNVIQELSWKHEVERAFWDGKPVKCQASVITVNGNTVSLFRNRDARHISYIHAKAKSKDDPILAKLKRGDVVEVQGTLEYHYRPGSGGEFVVNNCTIILKAAAPAPAIPPRPGRRRLR